MEEVSLLLTAFYGAVAAFFFFYAPNFSQLRWFVSTCPTLNLWSTWSHWQPLSIRQIWQCISLMGWSQVRSSSLMFGWCMTSFVHWSAKDLFVLFTFLKTSYACFVWTSEQPPKAFVMSTQNLSRLSGRISISNVHGFLSQWLLWRTNVCVT